MAPPAGVQSAAHVLSGMLLLACLQPATANAQVALRESGGALEYEGPVEKHYLRALLEELGLVSAGFGYYFLEQKTNSIDWALNYDWLSFRQKLTCEACAFDQNYFDTNFVMHPAAGMLYYLAARGNRLSVLESLGYGFAMSTLWEFVGEFRERVSVNDMWVTPISGFVLGESTTELAAFFDRSCPTELNRVLGALLGPSKTLHDAVDGARPARDTACDEHGFATRGAHRFHFWAGAAAVWDTERRAPANEGRFGIETHVAHLDPIRQPGSGWLAFSNGNVSSLELRLSLESEYVSDLRIGARVVPAGLHYRSLAGATSSRAVGHEIMLGLLVGTEYSEHRRDRPAGDFDRIFLIEAPASVLVYTLRRPAVTLEVSLEGGATLAGVSTFALPEYRARHSDADLASVTRTQGYSHALGVALAPQVLLALDGAEIGVNARSDRFFALRVLDPLRRTHGTAPIFETRRRGEGWLAIGPARGFPRARFFVEAYQRSGVAADARRSLHEVSLGASLDTVF